MQPIDELRRKSVLYYPSSGPVKDVFMDWPYGYMIFSDYWDREGFENKQALHGGKLLALHCENNKALYLMKSRGIRINHFLNTNDGCSEGGNYECCGHTVFIGRLIPLLDEVAIYTSGYGCRPRIRNVSRLPLTFMEIETPSYPGFERFRNLLSWLVMRKYPTVRVFDFGNVVCTVRHDTIWRDAKKGELLLVAEGDDQALVPYLGGPNCVGPGSVSIDSPRWRIPQGWIIWCRPGVDSMSDALRYADSHKIPIVRTVPNLRGRYKDFIDTLSCWKGHYPQEVHFYHIDQRDRITFMRDMYQDSRGVDMSYFKYLKFINERRKLRSRNGLRW